MIDAPDCAAHDGFTMNANSDREYIDNRVGDVRTAVDDLRVVMTERFTTVHARFDAVDAKIVSAIEAAKAEIIKWIAGLLIAMIGMFVATFLGIAGLMLNLLSHQPPAAQPPAAAPINTPSVIIQLSPQGAAVLPAAPAAKP